MAIARLFFKCRRMVAVRSRASWDNLRFIAAIRFLLPNWQARIPYVTFRVPRASNRVLYSGNGFTGCATLAPVFLRPQAARAAVLLYGTAATDADIAEITRVGITCYPTYA